MSGFYCYICGKNTDETGRGGFLHSRPVCNTCFNSMMRWFNRSKVKKAEEKEDPYAGYWSAEAME